MNDELYLHALSLYEKTKRISAKELNRNNGIQSIDYIQIISEVHQFVYVCSLLDNKNTEVYSEFHKSILLKLSDFLYKAEEDVEFAFDYRAVDFMFDLVYGTLKETNNEKSIKRFVTPLAELSVIMADPRKVKISNLNKHLMEHYVKTIRPVFVRFDGSYSTSKGSFSSLVNK